MGAFENIRTIRNNFKNWLSIGVTFKFSNSKRVKLVLRSGQVYVLWKNYLLAIVPLLRKGMSANEIIQNLLQDKIPYNNGFVVIRGWIKENNENNGNIFDVFMKEEYKFLNVENRIVLDIGASIGDSSIYFALNGAKKIISLEPYPYTFNFLVKNIKENRLNGKIIPLNAGYGLDDEIFVNQNTISNDGMDLRASQNGKKISICSLKTLINKFKIEEAVLKMDCEGCEYNLTNEDREIVQKFSQIQIEYHYGPEKLVQKLLNSGFSVEYSKPKSSFNPNAKNPNMALGYIYASKK